MWEGTKVSFLHALYCSQNEKCLSKCLCFHTFSPAPAAPQSKRFWRQGLPGGSGCSGGVWAFESTAQSCLSHFFLVSWDASQLLPPTPPATELPGIRAFLDFCHIPQTRSQIKSPVLSYLFPGVCSTNVSAKLNLRLWSPTSSAPREVLLFLPPYFIS